MTSELKPCPFCGGSNFSIEMKEHRHLNSVGDWYYLRCESVGCSARADYPSRDGLITAWNTRAAPDVPELVRYSAIELVRSIDAGYDPLPSDDGDYVEFSQAAEIIAADRAEIKRLRSLNHYAHLEAVAIRRAEAAEAKLAQYEAQEPIGFVSPSFFDSLNIKNAYSVAAFVVMEKSIKYNTPLYASPAPAADLKEKCDRYERALRGIAELSATGMSFGDQVFAVTSSRAALNVEASNDKG